MDGQRDTTASGLSREDLFRRELRDELVDVMQQGDIDIDEFAELTGLLPVGARALLQRKDWSLATCLRVAASLDVEVHARVGHRPTPSTA